MVVAPKPHAPRSLSTSRRSVGLPSLCHWVVVLARATGGSLTSQKPDLNKQKGQTISLRYGLGRAAPRKALQARPVPKAPKDQQAPKDLEVRTISLAEYGSRSLEELPDKPRLLLSPAVSPVFNHTELTVVPGSRYCCCIPTTTNTTTTEEQP